MSGSTNDERKGTGKRAVDCADFGDAAYTLGLRFLAWRRSQLPGWQRGLFLGLDDEWARWCQEKAGAQVPRFARLADRPIPPEA